MARSFGVPIALPADAASPLHATTKQQMDAAVATRAASSHTHAESDVTSLVSDLALKAPLASPTFTGLLTAVRVLTTPQTQSVTTTLTIDASTGDMHHITATGNPAFAVPTNPTNGQIITVAILASGADRTVTLNASILITGPYTAANVITSGKVGWFRFSYTTLGSSAWRLLSFVSDQ